MTTLHELALIEAERFNPGGKHVVTEVEIDGEPGQPGDARIKVHTRLPGYAETVNISITPVTLADDDDEARP